MRTEDKYKYDSTILGLENLYMVDCEGNYYINSSAIIAPDKTICTGRTYILVDSSKGKNGRMYPVVLMDVYCEDCVIYLILQDTKTSRIFNVDYSIDDGEIKGIYVLIDMDFFIQRLKGGRYGG